MLRSFRVVNLAPPLIDKKMINNNVSKPKSSVSFCQKELHLFMCQFVLFMILVKEYMMKKVLRVGIEPTIFGL